MVVLYTEERQVSVPAWVDDLESFRRWSDSSAFPEDGRIDFIGGMVCLDTSKEQVFSHVDVKSEINSVLRFLVKMGRRRRYFTDGAYFTSDATKLSVKPDGSFVSTESIERHRVQLRKGKNRGFTELLGVPDMLLEIVSDSSEQKDTVLLREAYARAGVKEYWLVDAREEPVRFEILRLTSRGFVSIRPKVDGWIASPVFGKSFRLVCETGDDGYPAFTLEVR
jgi:Uma2 family endonuclease